MNLNHYYRLVSPDSSGLVSRPERASWRVTGEDRLRYINGQVTNNILHLQPGQTCYAAVTTAKGKMQGDLFIRAEADYLWLDAPVSLRDALNARLTKYLIADDVQIVDMTDGYALTHFFGFEPMKYQLPSDIFQNGRSRRFGLAGTDIWYPRTEAVPSGELIDPEVQESLRLEFALAQWGTEMNEDTLPPEAGLERHGISYDKGCYIGQETIARIKSIGHVNKSLQVLEAPASIIPEAGVLLTHSGQLVGRLTSTGYSPLLQKGIALGYVGRQHAVPGTVLDAGGMPLTLILPPRQLVP